MRNSLKKFRFGYGLCAGQFGWFRLSVRTVELFLREKSSSVFLIVLTKGYRIVGTVAVDPVLLSVPGRRFRWFRFRFRFSFWATLRNPLPDLSTLQHLVRTHNCHPTWYSPHVGWYLGEVWSRNSSGILWNIFTATIKSEKSAQRERFWDGHPADIRGSFARISRPKTSVRAVKKSGKASILARTSMTRRRGRPRP